MSFSNVYMYGPWMDTNLVVPLGLTKCQVIFDYFLDYSLLASSCHYFSIVKHIFMVAVDGAESMY